MLLTYLRPDFYLKNLAFIHNILKNSLGIDQVCKYLSFIQKDSRNIVRNTLLHISCSFGY